jgi:hypothetical protein
MAKAFVETTILTDILLKPNSKPGKLAKAALNRYDETQLPLYAVKEFKAGPLKNYVWFHNKLASTKSFAKAIDALHRMSLTPKRYTTATVLEALREVVTIVGRTETLRTLNKQYGTVSPDAMLCDQHQIHLKTLIYKAWRNRRRITSSVVHPLNCYQELGPIEEHGQISLTPTGCDRSQSCCLASQLQDHTADIKKLRVALEKQPDNPENTRRKQVLRAIVRTPHREFTHAMCRQLGDAYFALFAPADACILTTNRKDIEPLASSINKATHSPDDSEE